nr:immunoglobulin heavy chain junction region [Mus musculus]
LHISVQRRGASI